VAGPVRQDGIVKDDELPEVEDGPNDPGEARLLGVRKVYASHTHGMEEWLVTDIGLVIMTRLAKEPAIMDLTLWREVRDVELRVELFWSEPPHEEYRLTMQVPRFTIVGWEEVGDFCRAVVRMAAGVKAND
jgi:hypothetical protein